MKTIIDPRTLLREVRYPLIVLHDCLVMLPSFKCDFDTMRTLAEWCGDYNKRYADKTKRSILNDTVFYLLDEYKDNFKLGDGIVYAIIDSPEEIKKIISGEINTRPDDETIDKLVSRGMIYNPSIPSEFDDEESEDEALDEEEDLEEIESEEEESIRKETITKRITKLIADTVHPENAMEEDLLAKLAKKISDTYIK